MGFLLRLLINAAALWVTTLVVPGVSFTGTPLALLGVAFVFGILNAVVRPILFFFSLPLVLLTLGLFTFVLNGIVLWLTSALSDSFGLGFHVRGIVASMIGALVVTITSVVLTIFIGREKSNQSR